MEGVCRFLSCGVWHRDTRWEDFLCRIRFGWVCCLFVVFGVSVMIVWSVCLVLGFELLRLVLYGLLLTDVSIGMIQAWWDVVVGLVGG